MFVLLAALFLPGAVAPAWAAGKEAESSQYYEDALVRFDKNDYAGAIIQLRNALKQDPGNLAARILLGRSHLKFGAAAAAEKELELARKAGADEELIVEPLAAAYLLQRKYSELLEKIISGNRSASIEAKILTARASANYEILRYEEAIADFEKAIALAPHLPGPLLGQARVLIRLGDFVRAEELADTASKLDPEHHGVSYIKAELHRLNLRLNDAVAAYGKALEKAANHLPARIGRATVLIDLGRHEEALPDLEFVGRIDRADPQVFYLQSLVYGRMGEQRKARASLRKADQIIRSYDADFVRSHGPTLLLSGVIANALEKPNDARFYLSEYIKLAPNHPGARRMLGSLYIKLDRPKKAIEVLWPVLGLAPDDWQAKALLGSAFMRIGELAKATRLLQEAVRIMPDRPSLRTRLALSHLAAGQDKPAIEALEIALRQSPDAKKPALLLGMVHMRLRRYDQAIAVARRMIEQGGETAVAYNLMGGAHLGAGDRKAGRASFEKALELIAGFKPALSNLARLDVREGKIEAAKLRYRTILRFDPQAIPAMVSLSAIAEKEDDLKSAIQWLEKAGSYKRKNIPSQLRLIDLYHRAGRSKDALFLAVRLKQGFASNLSVLAAVGGAELRTGAQDAAIKTFRRMSNMRPDSDSDLLMISRLQINAKDYEGAFNTLRRAVWVRPGNLHAQRAIVKLEIRLGNLDAARKRSEELRETLPKSGIGDELHGDVMMAQKSFLEAIDSYQASIEKTGGSSDLAIRVYLARHRAGQRMEAMTALESWAMDHPKDIAAQRTLAAGYITVGRYSKSILAHEKLYRSRPKDSKILNNLAWLYQRTGDKRALSFAQQAYRIQPRDPSIIDTLGWILVQAGQTAQGLTYLRDASARASRQPRIRYHLAVALSRLGRVKEARTELSAVLQNNSEGDPDLAKEAQELLDQIGE